jgi:hypothetical protein
LHLAAIGRRAEEFFGNPRFEPVTVLQKLDCGNEKAAIEEQEKSAELHVAHHQRITVSSQLKILMRPESLGGGSFDGGEGDSGVMAFHQS